MKLSGLIRSLTLAAICFSPLRVYSGMDEFTPVDKIESWLIERKIESITNRVFCRASIPLSGTWFSARIRLNPEDELVSPTGSRFLDFTEEEGLSKVKTALKECRSGLIYLSPN